MRRENHESSKQVGNTDGDNRDGALRSSEEAPEKGVE
jgi:hypothetical protein